MRNGCGWSCICRLSGDAVAVGAITERWSTGSSSGCGPAYPGVIFPSVSAVGRPSANAIAAGRRTVRGTGSSVLSRQTPTWPAGLTGAWSASTPPPAVPTNTQQEHARRRHAFRKRSTPRNHRPDEGLGRSRGGLTCKIHLAGEGGCRPPAFLVTPGQWGDAPQMIEVLERIRVHRPKGGHPRTRPDHVGGDKAYSSRRNRRLPAKTADQAHDSRAEGPAGKPQAAWQ